MDGLDAVLIRTKQDAKKISNIEILEHVYLPYSEPVRAWLREIIQDQSMSESSYFGVYWAEFAAKVAKKLLNKAKCKPENIHVMGVHGQTLFHAPRMTVRHGQKMNTTLQVGDLSRLAVLSGITVVGNFRTADLAAGGDGAPLAPHGHKLIFGQDDSCVCVQNMGGIGNVTVIKNGRVELAFDTGPGNLWVDTIVRWKSEGKLNIDKGGKLAESGTFYMELYRRLLDHPYFLQKPPKSTGFEVFGESFLNKWKRSMMNMKVEDALHTALCATVDSVLHAYEKYVFPKYKPTKMIVCGGGAKNTFMLELFRQRMNSLKVVTSDEEGIACDQVEAVSFALLALQTLNQEPNNEPKATGAKKSVVCGQVAYF